MQVKKKLGGPKSFIIFLRKINNILFVFFFWYVVYAIPNKQMNLLYFNLARSILSTKQFFFLERRFDDG